MEGFGLILGGILGVVALIFIFIFIYFFKIYIRAATSKATVPLFTLLFMKLRGVPPAKIVDAHISLTKAGLDLGTDVLEAHYLAARAKTELGDPANNVMNVVNALIAAEKANIDLSFPRAAAINLAGRDIYDAVQTSVSPKVIDCPDPSKGTTMLDAVAKDGIRLL
ncbi:MAG: flotillin-like FloA family protein, partial [Verrucomicrobiota bacterium]